MAPTWGHVLTVEHMRTSTSLVVQDLQSCTHFKQQHPLEVSFDGCDPPEVSDKSKTMMEKKITKIQNDKAIIYND
jgi:hypothetical protein